MLRTYVLCDWFDPFSISHRPESLQNGHVFSQGNCVGRLMSTSWFRYRTLFPSTFWADFCHSFFGCDEPNGFRCCCCKQMWLIARFHGHFGRSWLFRYSMEKYTAINVTKYTVMHLIAFLVFLSFVLFFLSSSSPHKFRHSLSMPFFTLRFFLFCFFCRLLYGMKRGT